MRSINLRRVLIWVSVFSLAIIYIFNWVRMLNDQQILFTTDFVPFYSAAQISRNEGPSHIYDLELQKRYEEKIIGFSIPFENINIFVNPPFVVPLVSLVITPDLRISLVLWELMMIMVFLIGNIFVFKLLYKEMPITELFIFLLGIILFFPFYKSLLFGQNSAILFLGASVWMYGLIRKKDGLAGLGLALMTIRPHIVLPLALPFLFKRRSVFWWFLIGSASLAAFSQVYSGLDGVLGFLKMITVSANGVNMTVNEKYMVNLMGFLIRIFPNMSLSVIHWAGWSAYIFNFVFLCTLWIRSSEIQGRQIGLALLLTTFTTPHLHVHDLVLWIIPLVLILLSVKDNTLLINKYAPLPLWFSMGFLACLFSPILAEVIPFLILVILIYLVYYSTSKKIDSQAQQEAGIT